MSLNVIDFDKSGQEVSPPLRCLLVLNGGRPPIEHDFELPVMLLHQVLTENRQHLINPSPVLVRGVIKINVGFLSEENDSREVWRVDRRQDGENFGIGFVHVHVVECDFPELLA